METKQIKIIKKIVQTKRIFVVQIRKKSNFMLRKKKRGSDDGKDDKIFHLYT